MRNSHAGVDKGEVSLEALSLGRVQPAQHFNRLTLLRGERSKLLGAEVVEGIGHLPPHPGG